MNVLDLLVCGLTIWWSLLVRRLLISRNRICRLGSVCLSFRRLMLLVLL